MPDATVQNGRRRFPRRVRLRGRGEFARVLRAGARASDAHLTLCGVRNGLAYTRLGMIVGGRYGGAVARNRIKRRLREAFRQLRLELPAGLDLVCIPRVGAALEPDAIARSLATLSARIHRRLAPEPTPPPANR
ncbi:MAG: ribonuclease P protein component [Phycisphaerae bacterium]